MFQKILVSIDGSDHSAHALDKAIQIAQKFEGKITVIHVTHSALVTRARRQIGLSV